MGIKYRIYQIIEKAEDGDKSSKQFDIAIIILIILNTISIFLESYEGIYLKFEDQFKVFEIVSVVIFTIEYLLRFWTATFRYGNSGAIRSRIKYSLSSMALIDLLAIIPFYLPMFFPIDLRFIRMVRITRLMRVIKINRYSNALNTIHRVITRKKEELLATVFVMGFVILVSATLMYYFETEVQPEAFPNIGSSLWWAIATLTTVGYGDIYPVTIMGKVLASVIAVSGIGLVALPTGIISSGFVDEINTKTKTKHIVCPHCSKKLDL